jgi:hypothetical protein
MKWLVERRNHVLDRLKVTGFNAFELATPSLTTIRLAYALGETAAERLLRRLKVGHFRRDADAAAHCAPRSLMMLAGSLTSWSRVWRLTVESGQTTMFRIACLMLPSRRFVSRWALRGDPEKVAIILWHARASAPLCIRSARRQREAGPRRHQCDSMAADRV